MATRPEIRQGHSGARQIPVTTRPGTRPGSSGERQITVTTSPGTRPVQSEEQRVTVTTSLGTRQVHAQESRRSRRPQAWGLGQYTLRRAADHGDHKPGDTASTHSGEPLITVTTIPGTWPGCSSDRQITVTTRPQTHLALYRWRRSRRLGTQLDSVEAVMARSKQQPSPIEDDESSTIPTCSRGPTTTRFYGPGRCYRLYRSQLNRGGHDRDLWRRGPQTWSVGRSTEPKPSDPMTEAC